MSSAALAHLERLLKGNATFAERSSSLERMVLALRQQPFAAILGCSDSRVPAEAVFNRRPGEVFVVRVIGNVVDDLSLASLEFAVATLGTPLVLVLGHSGCGAVQAAIERVRDGSVAPGHIADVIEKIVPAVQACRDAGDEWLERAVMENVRRNAELLARRSQILADASRDGRIAIRSAVYDLRSGLVELAE